jgi:asparaginyl-tRNA synthetase
MDRIFIKDIFKDKIVDQEALICGWIKSLRKSKKFSFMVLNDGSAQKDIQIIVDMDLANYDEVTSLLVGSSVKIKGKLVESMGKNQSVEMQALEVEIVGTTDDSYPLQKKATSLEFLREQAHLRARTNTFGAVFRIRHALAMATHKFFDQRGFYYLNTPIITANDAEGAGNLFNVSTLDLGKVPQNKQGVDYASDYFGKKTSLAVTGQLEAECFALGLNSVYTFGPTFRAENSNTTRHLAEFWMIEPEASFMDINGNAKLAKDYLQYMITYALNNCADEIEFLASRDKELASHVETLEKVATSEFEFITYTEAVKLCQESNKKFEFEPVWGNDLQTEHERYLAEEKFNTPVIVTDYPKDIKAFYMKQNDDGKTVRAMDVLVPGVGEIIGGSQREENLDLLEARMAEMNMDSKELWWYLELRKFGTVPHSGFGLGFERAVMYVTGMSNIRDVIAFPRTPGSVEF